MKIFQANLKRIWLFSAVFFLLLAFAGENARIFAHGGEDHGDEKPKTTASVQGTVLHTTRLGELEITLKHPVLTPDTPTTARLFVTKFATNEPDVKANPAVEIESGNGSVTPAKIEKDEQIGSYTVNFPALPQGKYTIRAKMTYEGETDTAVFSGIDVAPAEPSAAAETGQTSMFGTLLIAFIFLIVLALFGGLAYFVLRSNDRDLVKKETVSA
jgi:hypothetical protein